MKKTLSLVIGFLLISVKLIAASGDLIVNGNVGIGTASPGGKLHIVDSTAYPDFYAAEGGVLRAVSTYAGTGSNIAVFENVTAAAGTQLDIYSGSSGATALQARENQVQGAVRSILLNPNGGNVGVGRTNPAYPLHMGSGAYVTTGGVWTDASSREFKENIKDLSAETALDVLKELNPVTFNYKAGDEKHIGFVAEDVPELVASSDRKGLSAMDIVAVLTKVVQAQQKEIEELKLRLKD